MTSTQVEKAFHRIENFDCARGIVDLIPLLLRATRRQHQDQREIALYLSLIGRAFQFDENELPASQCFLIAHFLQPADLSITAHLAETLSVIGRHTEAQQLYKQLEPLAGSNYAASEALARAQMHLSNFSQAQKYLEKILVHKTFPKNANIERLLAKCMLKEGFTKSAAVHYRKAAWLVHSPYLKYMYLAFAATIENDLKSEEQQYLTAGRLLPRDPSWHTGLALLYLIQKKDDLCTAEFEKAVQSERLSSRAFMKFAEYLMSNNRADTALQCVDYLDRLKPYMVQGAVLRARIYARVGEKQKAELEFEKSIARNPFAVGGYVHFAQFHVDHKQCSTAMAILRKGIKLCPSSFELWNRLVATASAAKSWDEASTAANRLLDLAPKPISDLNPAVKHYLAFAHAVLGTNYFRTSQISNAIGEAKAFNKLKYLPDLPAHLRLIKLRPGRVEEADVEPKLSKSVEHMLVADMLQETWQYNDSIAELRKAIELDPDNLEYHGYLLHVLWDNGNWADAVKEDFILSQKLVSRVPYEVGKWASKSSEKRR